MPVEFGQLAVRQVFFPILRCLLLACFLPDAC